MDQFGLGKPDASELHSDQPRHDRAGVPTRINLEQKGVPRRHREGTRLRLDQLPTEEGPEPAAHAAARQNLLHAAGKESTQTGRARIPVQLGSEPKEELGRVGPPDHELDEPLGLPVRDPATSPRVVPVPSDLRLDHTRKSEAPGKGHRQVLVVEDLDRPILVAQRLEESECHARVNPAGGLLVVPG